MDKSIDNLINRIEEGLNNLKERTDYKELRHSDRVWEIVARVIHPRGGLGWHTWDFTSPRSRRGCNFSPSYAIIPIVW